MDSFRMKINNMNRIDKVAKQVVEITCAECY